MAVGYQFFSPIRVQVIRLDLNQNQVNLLWQVENLSKVPTGFEQKLSLENQEVLTLEEVERQVGPEKP